MNLWFFILKASVFLNLQYHEIFCYFFSNILFCSIVWAQQGRYISGRITDGEDGASIPYATVFFTGTTVGTTTDLDGNYRIGIPGEGSYNLSVSHVGYQAVTKDIEPGMTSVVFDVAMQIQEIEGVEVSARVRFRRADINLFWKTVLGKNPSGRTIQATNPETVYYYYNSETQILKVTCREPLQIVNYETGYHIHCVLDHFTHDYSTGITNWSVQSVFTELEPTNLRQKNNWEKKREEIYNVSLTKFIRSLYNNSLQDDGFVLADFITTADPSNPFRLFMQTPDNLLSTGSSDNGKTLNLADHQLLLICYGRPLTGNDLEMLMRSQHQNEPTNISSSSLSFRSSSEPARNAVTPLPFASLIPRSVNATATIDSGAELALRSIAQGDRLDKIGLYRNLLLGNSIRLFPDGTYTNRLQMAPVDASETLLGLSLRLPLEYYPEGSILSATVSDAIFEDSANILVDIDWHFNEQLRVFPQEKIHLHTDRDLYVPGEKIWFKAYIADANSHLSSAYSDFVQIESTEVDGVMQQMSDNYSWYVYVELISPVDTLVSRVLITQTGDEMFYGYLPLPAMVSEGDYTLRAYTRYMENLGDEYFFKKNIRIGNLNGGNQGSRESSGSGGNRENSINTANLMNPDNSGSDYDVTFFPEGGSLPGGVVSKIAFKALNRSGYPETVSGYIVDEYGAEITAVQTYHAGMGVFAYLPETGKRYRLKCINETGLEKLFDLPQPDPRAYSLAVSMQNNSIRIGVQKSVQSPDIPCYLLVHCRGSVLYFAEWANLRTASFDVEQLPAGVIQAVLFDGQMNPLSERLIFSKNDACVEIDFHTDKDAYQMRDKIIATLSFPDTLLYTRAGHFSIAVTDDRDIAVDESTTILSSLLLSSELKGYIENPAYYLRDDVAMDLLMMTHGWRRYNIPEVAKGHLDHPRVPYQVFQGISGRVTGLLNRPVTDSAISMLMRGTEGSDYRVTTTDSNGSFTVPDLVFADSTSIYIQASGRNGSDNVTLVVDNESFPSLVYAPQSLHSSLKAKSESEESAFVAKAEQRMKFDEDIWTLYLDEVIVTASRIAKRDDPRLKNWANTLSDYTITRTDIERMNLLNAYEYLMTLPGVTVSEDSKGGMLIVIRGSGVSASYVPPLLMIDGVYSDDFDFLKTVNANTLESIDVIAGVGASLFGSQGGSGVISITTIQTVSNLNSQSAKSNHFVFTPLGYQNPVEFYSPKYESLQARQSNIPDYRTTIFWKPDVVISEEGEASFEFYTSDMPTTYSVVIEGLTDDGKIIRQVEKIKINY